MAKATRKELEHRCISLQEQLDSFHAEAEVGKDGFDMDPFDTAALIVGAPVTVIVDIQKDGDTPGVGRVKCEMRMIERV